MILKISDSVAEFVAYQAGRGLAEGTVARHEKGARAFLRACEKVKGAGATTGQIDHACVSRFFQDITGSQGYRNNLLETVKRYLEWAEKWGYLRPGFTAAKLLDGYKGRKAERQPKYYLSRDEFPAALEAAGARHPVDRAILALALFTLARQSEISTLRLCDLDLAGREVRIYREKRDRWTTTGMTPQLADELQAWLRYYADQMGYLSPHTMIREHPDWLVCPARARGDHGQLQPSVRVSVMERVAKRVLTDLGVQGTRQGRSRDHLGEGMHTFRRSGARAFLKVLSENLGHQRALVQVSIMLDHDSIRQTLAYIGVAQERDELNDWLKGNDMYGQPEPPAGGELVPFRRAM